jgi:hypothetical protein
MNTAKSAEMWYITVMNNIVFGSIDKTDQMFIVICFIMATILVVAVAFGRLAYKHLRNDIAKDILSK